MSPILFILVVEAFIRGLHSQVQHEAITAYSAQHAAPMIPLLCFADDMIVFMHGFHRSICGFLNFLESYKLASSQKISKPKSSFYVSKKSDLALLRWISGTSGFSQGSLLFKYLGSVLNKGRRKKVYYHHVVDRFWVSCWAGKEDCCRLGVG